MRQKLIPQLQAWDAVPAWRSEAATVADDWVRSLHSNVAGDDWPQDIRTAIAKVVEGDGGKMFAITATGSESAIGVLQFTPAYLWQIIQIVNYPLVPPGSADPNAPMLLDPSRKPLAARMLAEAAGMLWESGYLDGSANWGGGVVFGTRFLYYHELGHLMRASGRLPLDISLDSQEEPFAEEIYADQFALGMLVLELRNQSVDLQVVGFSGISSVVSLLALSEFARTEFTGDTRRTQGAVYRMGRLKYYAEHVGVADGYVSPQALRTMEWYWSQFADLLRMVDEVPSPMSALLQQTAARPKDEWRVARNEIVKWCAFGDCERVRSRFAELYRLAEVRSASGGNDGALKVMRFILDETRSLEPELGLLRAIESSR